MLLDTLTKLGSAQAFAASGYTTDSMDLGAVTPKRRIGAGTRLSLVFVITTAPAGDSASITDTYDFIAVQSVNSNLGTHDEMVKVRRPASELTVGKIVEVPLPVDRPTKQYIGGRVEVGTGDTISASSFLIQSDQVQAFVAYAKGYSV